MAPICPHMEVARLAGSSPDAELKNDPRSLCVNDVLGKRVTALVFLVQAVIRELLDLK